MLIFSRNVDGYYDVADQMIHDLRGARKKTSPSGTGESPPEQRPRF